MTRALPGLVALVLSLSACVMYTSNDPRHDPQFATGHGVMLALQLSGGRRIGGELLSVDTTGLLLLRDEGRQSVVMVPFRVVRSVVPGFRLAPEHLPELRSRARFPMGIPPAAIAALLRDVDRAVIDTLPHSR